LSKTRSRASSTKTDYLARGLKARQTSVIGLLAPMVSDALASQVMQGVEEEAQERGYAGMLGRTGAKSAYIAGYLRAMTEAKCTPVTATASFFYESGAGSGCRKTSPSWASTTPPPPGT
jgi:hypothetical protein